MVLEARVSKHERVLAVAKEHGWTANVSPAGDSITLAAVRGAESMLITWVNGGLQHPLTYSLAGVRDVKLRNVAAALKQMAEQPNYSTSRARRPTVDTDGEEIPREALPFEMDDDDAVIIRAVRGKVIIWKNSMVDQYERGQVPPPMRLEVPDGKGGKKRILRTSRNIYLTTSAAGRRILTFPAVNEQFRSVGLDAIVAIR